MGSRTFALSFILFGSVAFDVAAQPSPPDSIKYSKQANQVINYFTTAAGSQAEFVNGIQYILAPPANKGTHYFRDKNYCVPSLIRFNNTWYKDVPVLYDVFNDEMISFSGNDLFVLNTEKVSDVYLLDHHFVHLSTGLAPGFYDLLYDGKSQVLAKRTKFSDDEIIQSQTVKFILEDRSALFVKKGDKYYPITGKGSLTNVFADRKKEINQYIRDHKLDYKTDKEGMAAAVAAYYDQLTK
ncbi:MAG TPA: hypothetical protein VJ844_13310 [Mucilaginibacter sp.]|nr:hypothetical protein [Mucilaginibacter sp.]